MSDGSVTRWIDGVKGGDDDAIQGFVDRYFDPIVQLVRKRLPSATCRRSADEEDVAISTLKSFVGRAQDGQFSQLENRDDLWKLLVTISTRKASKHVVRETAQKRGGGKVRGESVFVDAGGGLDRFTDERSTPQDQMELDDCAEEILDFLNTLKDTAPRDIAIWKSHGLTDQSIAERLDCSTKTVERKRRLLREKAQKWAESAT